MDRYQRVEKPKEETPINENEIRITTQGRMRNYITYATSLLQEKGSNEIVLKAMGRAINKTITIVELIKKRIVGLHQNTAIGSTDITDTWEPLEEGLLPLETTRHVSVMTITLSKTELDTSAVGYQPPLPRDQMKPFAEFEYGESSPPERERGYGRRGRGRTHGNGPPDYGDGNLDGRGRGYSRGNGPPDYDENWDNRGRGYGRGSYGRGRGQAYRGRGRGGYAGRFDYQQETGSYAYDDEAPIPSQGRGNGPPEYDENWDNRGRGYGRGGYGRGRGQAYRGRGRGGYAGRFDYQQETSSYAYDDEAPAPSQGRGRGYGRGRGRGRGPIQGRGRNSRPNGVIHSGTDGA